MAPPTPQERLAVAEKHAALVRALILHPGTKFKGDKVTDPASTNPTLYNVIDFAMSTYIKYLLPVLPVNATKNCRALANPWSYDDPEFKEDLDQMAPSLYPDMKTAGLMEKWNDALGRGTLIQMIILDKSKHAMFGGAFDFGEAVEAAAKALTNK